MSTGIGHPDGKDEQGEAFIVSMAANQRVTYTWENMEVFLEVKQGNPISRLCKNLPPIQKRILDNGTTSVT